MRGEGVRRLSIAAGALLSAGWFLFAFIASEYFTKMDAYGWMVSLLGIIGFFGVGWVLVQGTAWVVDGFRQ
jgi:hypothetical protein